MRFRCSECGHTFPVHGEGGAPLPPALLPVEPPPRGTGDARPVAPGEPVEMLRVGGDVYSVPDLASLQRWILEGRVARTDHVSQHGMRWTAIGDRADFAIFFAAADRLSASGPTLSPAASPIGVPGTAPGARRDAGLPMAPEEEIYVREEVEPGESATAFVATPPQADELPPIADVIPREPTSETIAALEASSPALPPVDDPTVQQLVDEVPAVLLGRQAPPPFEADAPTQDLHADARQLGFHLGPDPDTQESTVEATQLSGPDLADAFMATGNMPVPTPASDAARATGGARPAWASQPGLPQVPARPSPPVAPPVPHFDGRVPVTVAPQSIPPRSVLDDDEPLGRPRSNAMVWGVFGAVALALLVALAWIGWASARRVEAEKAGLIPSTVEAGDAPGATPAVDAAAENAKADPAAAEKAAAEEAAKADAEKAAAEKAAAEKAATDEAAALRAEAERKAQADARAQVEASRRADERARSDAAKTTTPTSPATVKPRGTSAKALADAGWKAIDNGQIEEAHGFFARALQADGDYGWALYGRGYANEKLGDRVSARADYCYALSRSPDDAELVRELTGGLRRLGQSCG